MNQALSEAIVVRWAGGLTINRPPLASLAELADTLAKHLPDPAFDVVHTSPPPKTVARRIPSSSPKTKPPSKSGACTWKGCDRPRLAKGFCSTHYERDRTGKPMDAPIRGKREPKPAKEDDPAPALVADEPEKTTDKPVMMRELRAGEAEMFQKTRCRRYQRCSLVAKRRKWAGWSCSACTGAGTPKVGG
jgi:hypothetical protein